MNVVYLILVVVAAVCFAAAACGLVARVNLVALGLFAWVMVEVLVRTRGLN